MSRLIWPWSWSQFWLLSIWVLVLVLSIRVLVLVLVLSVRVLVLVLVLSYWVLNPSLPLPLWLFHEVTVMQGCSSPKTGVDIDWLLDWLSRRTDVRISQTGYRLSIRPSVDLPWVDPPHVRPKFWDVPPRVLGRSSPTPHIQWRRQGGASQGMFPGCKVLIGVLLWGMRLVFFLGLSSVDLSSLLLISVLVPRSLSAPPTSVLILSLLLLRPLAGAKYCNQFVHNVLNLHWPSLLAGKWPDRNQTCTRWTPGKPASRVCSRSRSKVTWYGHFCAGTKIVKFAIYYFFCTSIQFARW